MTETRTSQYIHGYRIVAPIGVGSSATVYRALDESTGIEVAIKVLADNHSLLPEMRDRFVTEVELLAAIDSDAVAEMYHLGETESGQPFMVMQLADRGDLRHRVDDLRLDGRSLGSEDVMAVAEHLAESLSALHRADIVHRDVSPGNILIRAERTGPPFPGPSEVAVLQPDERFLLADLGFAKDLLYASGLTAGGGTKGFASPEQRDEVTVVDHRCDVFSATAVLAWLSAGTDIEEALDDFFDTGMAAEPDERFDSMTDWLDALRATLAAPSPGALTAPPRWTDSREVWVGVTLAVLAALAAAVLVWPSRSEPVVIDAPPEPVPRAPSSSTGPDEATTAQAERATPAAPEPSSTVPTASSARRASTASPTVSSIPVTSAGPSSTAASVSTSSTTAPDSTSTTIDPRFVDSVRAYIRAPVDEGVISGDLRLSGDANYDDGVRNVTVVVRNVDTGQHWHDTTKTFRDDWIRFEVPISPSGASEVTWSYTVPADRLSPGRYMIRVWARAVDGTGDPISDIIHVTVT